LDWNVVLAELTYRTSRSSGAGGQHVNKTETKVEVLFDVNGSSGLNDEEKSLVYQKLGARINDAGILAITSQKERSQLANKEIVVDKLRSLLERALVPTVKRVKTRPTRQSVEDRLQEKKIQSEKKALRQKPGRK
jgi:ribosome-associated protein